MALGPKLIEKLNKVYAADSRVDQHYNGKDLTFITNASGEPVTLFIGKRLEDGTIAGERYVRKIIRDAKTNKIQRSHWDLKGKVTRGG
jgi:predicted Holliday junction resolvase-like endonuclease